MDSYYSLMICADQAVADAAAGEISDITRSAEKLLSAFDEGSVTYRLNSRENVSGADLTEIVKILNITENVSRLCDGRYSAVCGAITRLWEINSGIDFVPAQSQIQNAAALCGSDKIVINDDGSISFLTDGTLLDFGSVGKGYACDKAMTVFDEMGVEYATASFGGSILTYGNKTDEKWNIGVRSPFDQSSAGTVEIDGTAFISTSGGYERYFEVDGKAYHHIFDLESGMPSSSSLASVTVISNSGVLSDALSTACFILGKEEAGELLKNFENVSAVFIENDKSVYTYNASGIFEPESGFDLKGEI